LNSKPKVLSIYLKLIIIKNKIKKKKKKKTLNLNETIFLLVKTKNWPTLIQPTKCPNHGVRMSQKGQSHKADNPSWLIYEFFSSPPG
jgi:hypothetical protein